MSIVRFAVVILLAVSLAACAGIRPEPPDVQLAGLEITDLSLSHANFLATLRLYNPNNRELAIKSVKFTLFLNSYRIARGQTAKTLTIPAEETGEAAVRLSSSFLDLLLLSRNLQEREDITFRIVGEISIGGFGLLGTTIPIEREGTLPLSGSLNQLKSANQLRQLTDPPEKQLQQ